MNITYMHLVQSRAAINSWPEWLDKDEYPDLSYVTEKGEERITLPARATKMLTPDRQELCSYNAGFRIRAEEINYTNLADFYDDVQVRAENNAQQAVLIAEPGPLMLVRCSLFFHCFRDVDGAHISTLLFCKRHYIRSW